MLIETLNKLLVDMSPVLALYCAYQAIVGPKTSLTRQTAAIVEILETSTRADNRQPRVVEDNEPIS